MTEPALLFWGDVAAIIQAFAISGLLCRNALLAGVAAWTAWWVQDAVAGLLGGASDCGYLTSLLCDLHWLLLRSWREIRLLSLNDKALRGLGPAYVTDPVPYCYSGGHQRHFSWVPTSK